MKKSLDLVLINPSSRLQIYQSLGDKLAAIEPPVWAGMMATVVRNHGYSVEIIDGEADQLTPDQIADRISELKPVLSTIVVYGHQPSASTQNMSVCSAVCSAIKNKTPEQKVLLVGGHVAALPRQTLEQEEADFICSGEGLFTLVELITALNSSSPQLQNVRDLWYWDGDHIKSTSPAPLFTEIEQKMPGLAWDLLPMEKYRAHNWHCFGDLQRQPYAAIYTTLGCPYHCSFCCIQAPFKSGEKAAGLKETVNSYRFWKPETVVGQIELLVNKYGVRNLKIADEMFVLNPRHVLGLCDLLIERKLNVNIWAYARVDTVKENMVDKLKQAGFNWLAFGIEAANERVRQDVEKGFGQEKIFDTLRRVRSSGINVIGNYIFGLPEDDLQTMQATLDMALDLNCEFGNFYCAMAYPGSRLFDMAVQKGWPLPPTWSGYSQHSYDSLPLPTKHLPASEVLRFRDKAFQTYFTHPAYLDMVARKFGTDTVNHIQKMTAHKLARKHVPETSSVSAN